MEEKIKQIASNSLEMNITVALVDLTEPETGIGGNNFPFKDSSEIEISEDKESFPICNIPEKIPVHLKKFLDEPIFVMFSKKYSQHSTELVIMDERPGESLVHYGITATSEDGLFSASTVFHVNTCTDEIKEDFPLLFCRNITQNETRQSFNQEDIVTSLQLEEFCIIPLDPWRNSIHEYGKIIQEKRLELFDVEKSDNTEEIRINWNEHERLDSLRAITFLIVNDGLDSETTQKKIGKYTEKFGSLPDELSELIEHRIGKSMTDSESAQESYKNTDTVIEEHETRQIKLETISESDILSKGIGFNFSEDAFTEEDLKKLQEREWELRKIFENPDTSHEERDAAVKEFNEMQLRLQNPFQTGVPYELAKVLREKMMLRGSLLDNRDLYTGQYPEPSGAWHTSDKYQAIIVDIKSEYFTIQNLERYDEFVRGFLGNEINILYKK